jgi:non-heme chloroperoxidase
MKGEYGPRQLRAVAAKLQSLGDASSRARRTGIVFDEFWLWSMQSGLKNSCESVMSLWDSDFTGDLERFDVPTLVVHGDDDQVVPIHISGAKSARMIKNAKDLVYPGAPHGLTATHQDQLNADLLGFLQV